MAKTGRPPVSGESRDKPLCVRFSAAERKAINASRGSLSQSDFVRQAVRDATKVEQQ
jgi:hypothetical protein